LGDIFHTLELSNMTTLVNVTDHSFDAQVLKCDIPVLADFWADWCEPCKALEAPLQEIAGENPERVKVVKLDIESNPMVTSTYRVLTLPTLILFKNGQEVIRISGAPAKQTLLEKLSPYFDQ
jgi:thioredoxin 1